MRGNSILAMGALVAALVSPAAGAVGLGPIEVQSALNEPFSARIPLSGLADGEAESMRVVQADDAAYARAGLDRGSSVITALRFKPVASGERAGHIQITTRDHVREPGFSFIVQVESGGQVLQRRYDVLLNLDR